MACQKERLNLDGISQLSRLPQALEEGFVKVDDRSEAELYQYLRTLAGEVLFYNLEHQVAGTWINFFPSEFQNFVLSASTKPHLALLQVFLKTYLLSAQKGLNAIPEKHLDYFFRKILGFQLQEARPDEVFVYFELAKGIANVELPAGTKLTGNDPVTGLKLMYQIPDSTIIGKARIQTLKSIFADKDRGIIYASSIANSADGIGAPLPPGQTAWPAFGESQIGKPVGQRSMQEASIGFALSSTLFHLSEGTRSIFLTLTLNQAPPLTKSRFRVWCSSESGWQGPYAPAISAKGEELKFSLVLPADAPSVTPFSADLNLPGYHSDKPYLFFELDHQILDRPYDLFFAYNQAGIRVKEISATVQVDGLVNNCMFELGFNSVVPNVPFPLLGPQPQSGSIFRLRCPEASQKNLSQLSLLFNWLSLPFYFGNYYAAYAYLNPDLAIQDANYKLSISSRLQSLPKEERLFLRSNVAGAQPFNPIVIKKEASNTYPTIFEDELLKAEFKVVGGPLEAFGHQEFPNVLATQLLDKSDGVDTAILPKPPYTPVVKEFKLGYIASATGLSQMDFFHVMPFEVNKVQESEFAFVADYEANGSLYIHLEAVDPGQVLNILIQIPETPATKEKIFLQDALVWNCWTKEGWKQLSGQDILADSTYFLQQSGIISLQLPLNIAPVAIEKDQEQFILRADLRSHNQGHIRFVDLFTQATRALSISSETGVLSIPSYTLNKLGTVVPGIKKVFQPLPSFGGLRKESFLELKTRACERIRHKNRAVQYWDFERIVLANFPEIFKAKCLFHSTESNDRAAGSVALVVVPFIREAPLAERLEPRASTLLKQKIKAFIESFCSAWVEVVVEDPVYEQLLLDFKVRFYPGKEPSVYLPKLKEAIYSFLSPWAFEGGKDYSFENRIHRSAVIYFIERLPYVDYITDLKMYHAYNGPSLFGIGCMEIEADFIVFESPIPALGGEIPLKDDMIIEKTFVIGFESELAIATSAKSILVSSLQHRIEVLNLDDVLCNNKNYEGIGVMAVGRDFIIGVPC